MRCAVRPTFVDEPASLGKRINRDQALPETVSADAPANDLGISAEGVRGWKARKADAQLAAEAPVAAPPVKAM